MARAVNAKAVSMVMVLMGWLVVPGLNLGDKAMAREKQSQKWY